jgi:hypothetical protein
MELPFAAPDRLKFLAPVEIQGVVRAFGVRGVGHQSPNILAVD